MRSSDIVAICAAHSRGAHCSRVSCMTTIDDCRLLDFPRSTSRQGSITPLEAKKSVPFDIARMFYIYDVPGGANRGGHAHRESEQLIVSIMSSFDVVLDDGSNRRTVTLNRAYY